MFTGIVEEVGRLVEIQASKDRACLTVVAEKLAPDLADGDSVSVNGACLTVTSVNEGIVTFDVVTETLRKTTLGSLSRGDPVNLEGALRVGDRLSGHFVSGHVDGVGSVVGRLNEPGQTTLRIRAPEVVAEYLLEKGSITVAGVSLTTWEVRAPEFSVALVPHTLANTILEHTARGDPVNLEADLIARWVAKLVGRETAPGITEERLRDAGFNV